jgi:hypothetical protein
VANAIVQHVTDASLRVQVCNQFMDHLQLSPSELPDCPATASGGTTCPALPATP